MAEIFIPTGSPFNHSFFYDFKENKLSIRYDFVLLVEGENDLVVTSDEGFLKLWNLRNNQLLDSFPVDNIDPLTLFTFAKYSISLTHNTLIFYYSIKTKEENWSKEYQFSIKN